MSATAANLLKPLASLRLTVTLLALSMVLIFAGTTVQSEMGIWDVQRRYFHSWMTIIEWRLFFPLWEWGKHHLPGAIPFPGGYTLILLLLVNLVAAHTLRFKLAWKRSGVLLIHAGLILMLLGEVATSALATEGNMTIFNGSSANFVADTRRVELAITDPSSPEFDQETIIPMGRLMRKGTVQHPSLPFSVRIDDFYGNSTVLDARDAEAKNAAHTFPAGDLTLALVEQKRFTGTDGGKIDTPSAHITLTGNDGRPLGGHIVSTIPVPPRFPQIDGKRTINVDGKDYYVQLRYKRGYKPYTVHLIKFSHDRYLGTNVPRNFSSRVRVIDKEKNVDREALIWMNHPLYYAGETFYQAGFDPEADRYTILQVVHNPGWAIPYISCILVSVGMLVHFGIHLVGFLRSVPAKVSSRNPQLAAAKPSWIPATIITGVFALYLISKAMPARSVNGFEMNQFARVPVCFDGRVMPLDSLARNSLRILGGRSEVRTRDESYMQAILRMLSGKGNDSAVPEKIPASIWLADLFAQPEKAMDYRVFRIDHPDIVSMLGLDESHKRFSLAEMRGKFGKLQEQYRLARAVEAKRRDAYQAQVMELAERVELFIKLSIVPDLLLSPPLATGDWRSYDDSVKAIKDKGLRDPAIESLEAMLQAYEQKDPGEFSQAGMAYNDVLQRRLPEVAGKLDLEVLFNRMEPFYYSMVLYVAVFVLSAISWLKWHGPLARAVLWLLVLVLIFHTSGLIVRIYLQGRPPVTNLYSSAVFIAWSVVVFCVVLELIYRNGVACAVASAIAFPSLLVAHHLAQSGDTMRMLQAVLDTNIWLATHVVVVTLGYAATFLAGFLAIAYVLGGVLTSALTLDVRKTISRMIYGILCFAVLFSFVGTVLGGIWADQSWGRFWGWDPKENGAVLIVLWNAIILHARWGGLVRERGIAMLAIFGNVITAWSWFGTNLLDYGLHSYGGSGGMDRALFWLAAFVMLQFGILAVASLPLSWWRSLTESRGFAAKPAQI